MINRDLEKRRNQAFFMTHCKRTVTTVQCGHFKTSHSVITCLQCGRDWIRFDHREKIHLWSTCCSFEKKKNSRLVNNFPDFTSIFKTFFTSGKLLGKFQEFKTLHEPWKELRCKGNLPVLAASDIMATSFVPFRKLFLCDTMQSKKQRLMFNYTRTTLLKLWY